ncbi:MAG: hypothetical protein ACREJC_16765 [Tepidisphaeraceae bacterium]
MSRAVEPGGMEAVPEAQHPRDALSVRHLCPFCGTTKLTSSEPCPRCGMEDTPATRQSTKARIGPWYVLQSRNPSAPGMRFSTLQSLVAKGVVTPRSIVRGPTTHQLWRFAAHVRGLSREFGLCYSCGAPVERKGAMCPACERPQEPPLDPDVLVESKIAAPPAPGSDIATRPQRRDDPMLPTQLPQHIGADGEHSARLRAANDSLRGLSVDHNRRSDVRFVTPGSLASALQDRSGIARPRPHYFRRFLAFTVLLGSVGGVALLYVRPDYRQQARDWTTTQWKNLRERIDAWKSPPANAASDASQAAQAPPPAARPQVPPAQERTPPAAQSGAGGSADAALSEMRKLYNRALDASARHDYAEAVRCYERIMVLPREVWPSDLQVRLDVARRLRGG